MRPVFCYVFDKVPKLRHAVKYTFKRLEHQNTAAAENKLCHFEGYLNSAAAEFLNVKMPVLSGFPSCLCASNTLELISMAREGSHYFTQVPHVIVNA